jgi:hypothetical protein
MIEIEYPREMPNPNDPSGEWIEVVLTVQGEGEPHVPAKICGPPEDCYPAEGGYAHITEILGEDGKPWKGELTEDEERQLEEYLYDAFVEQMQSAAEDAAIARYESRMEDEGYWR